MTFPASPSQPGPIVDSRAEPLLPRAPLEPPQREVRVAEMLREAPVSVRGILTRAFAGESSPRGAVKAMCLCCTGYQRETIAGCTGYSCPLWHYRPYQAEEADE